MNWAEQALEKLDREFKAGTYDRYAQIMKQGVLSALKDFCQQDEEFAQAVAQGGDFQDCMKAVAKKCGSGISDIEAYTRAARFYFPGCGIQVQMRIDLCGSVNDDTPPSGGPCLTLNLADFL